MRSDLPRIASLGVLCGLGLALLATPVRADARQSYLGGVKAARRGDWDEVIRLMEEAIAEDPVAKERARLVGAIPDPYLPHYYLGKAHYEKRECDRALAAWRVAREQRAVASRPDLDADLERGAAHCRDLRRAGEAVAQAEQAARRLAASIGAGSEHWSEPLESRRTQASARLAAARDRLAESRSRWTPEPAAEAARLAAAAADDLDALSTELEERSRAARRDELRAGLEAPAAAGRRLLDQAMGRPTTLALETAAAELRELLGSVAAANGETPVADLESLSRRLQAAVERLRAALEETEGEEAAVAETLPPPPEPPPPPALPPAAAPARTAPPQWLLDAAQAYFDGDYRVALEILDRDLPQRGRVPFFAHLFRAAARQALYLLGGEEEAGLREAALLDLGECRRRDPAFEPGPEYFSPRFIELYRSARPGGSF